MNATLTLCYCEVLLAQKNNNLLPQILFTNGLQNFVCPVASLALMLHELDLVPGPNVDRYASTHQYSDQEPNISKGHLAGKDDLCASSLHFVVERFSAT